MASPHDISEGPIVRSILAGTWVDPSTGHPLVSPIRAIRVAPSLDGAEADLVSSLDLGRTLSVITDDNTWAAMGRRVAKALRRAAGVSPVVLRAPHADEETLTDLTDRVRHADGLVAVGTGTINDLCKAVSATTGKPYAVFGTAASMNGYTTGTVSMFAPNGVKTTRKAVMPRGVFLDLQVLRRAPARLTLAGLGDSICRTTAQVDWLLSRHLLGTNYTETPYLLQTVDEEAMFATAGLLPQGDLPALAALCRILILMGIGTVVTGTTQYGSGSEHLTSHAIDMLAGRRHPGSMHGEQTGIATLSMARLQESILDRPEPPRLSPTQMDVSGILNRFGPAGPDCMAEFRRKSLDARAASDMNHRLDESWTELRTGLLGKLRRITELERAMAATGAPLTAEDLGLDAGLYRQAILHAREIRNRYSVLDLAGDSGLLSDFAASQG
jgi:glycerol-1-phosphate dehydrogenase [NAD(P)+]